jgi:hypothetical protein
MYIGASDEDKTKLADDVVAVLFRMMDEVGGGDAECLCVRNVNFEKKHQNTSLF